MARTASPHADEIVWTKRQRAVLDLLAKGHTNGQIADALGISLDGAKYHVSEIITRLQVDTREEAAEYWRKRNGVVGRLRSSVRRRVSHVALGWLGAGGVAAAVAVAVPLVLVARGDDVPQASTGVWERLPDGPLSPRNHAFTIWTGEEILFIGGTTFLCPPHADCFVAPDPPLRDGAALNPATREWRTIAPAPVGVAWGSSAVIGDYAYLAVLIADPAGVAIPGYTGGRFRSALLRYSLKDDAWEDLSFPLANEVPSYGMVATDGKLAFWQPTHEEGEKLDFIFDPASGGWFELPKDPLAPGFDRRIFFAGGKLHLFDKALVPRPGSDGPALVRAARLDLATGTWERLPDTEMIGDMQLAADGRIAGPTLGGADGGEVNNYGRVFPFGGIIDASSGSWRELPNPPSDDVNSSAGVFASASASYAEASAAGGWVLDLERENWVFVPPLDPVSRTASSQAPVTIRAVAAAGRDAVVLGGWDPLESTCRHASLSIL